MNAFILEHEPVLRLAAFAGVFALMALWELAAPKRGLAAPKGVRWLTNIAITALNTMVLRFLFPVLAVGVALLAEEAGFGLFHWLAPPA